jgi:hypothetical protein
MSGYTLTRIRQLFQVEGFALPRDFELPLSAQRRSTAEAFERAIEFGSPDDAEAYLHVVERLLDELGDTYQATSLGWAYDGRERILRELRRAGIVADDKGRFQLPSRVTSSQALVGAPTESGIRLAITRLHRPGGEPEEAVGAAKELIEATIKYALSSLGETFDSNDNIPALAKQLHKRLRLDPKAIAPTTRGADTIIRILGGLTQVPLGLAELRNEGYGTGHGQAKRISGIRPRHAELAARSAIAYASFILDTLTDPAAPWRPR